MTNWDQTRPLFWSPTQLARTGSARDQLPGSPADQHDTPCMETESGPPDGQPICVPPSSKTPTIFDHPALEGFRLLQREEENAFSEIWKVETSAGQIRVLHRFFGLNPQQAAEGITRLQAISHPGLLRLEFLCGYGDQALFLGENHDHTLRDVFQRYWNRRFPGIPQIELMDYLRQVAETLDSLMEQHGLFHFGLNPANLVFKDGKIFLKGFGLVQLLWMPDKWLPPLINPRYCPPEFFQGRITPKSDQYSLALIYAEMRTGIHPFARHSLPQTSSPDLGLLSSAEKAVLLRALNAQAYARFPSCRALLKALAADTGFAEFDYGNPCGAGVFAVGEGNLQGLRITAATDSFFRTLREHVLGSRQLGHTGEFSFVTQPGEILEHTCLVRMDLDQFLMQLERLLIRWQATHVERKHELIFFCLGEGFSLSPDTKPAPFALKVRIELRPARRARQGIFHAIHLRIRPDVFRPVYSPEALEELGLTFVRGFRDHFGAVPDLRIQPRWDCPRPLRVLPADHNSQLLHAVDCTGKDISATGIGFFAPGWIPAAQVYLHLPWLTGYTDQAVRATVVRCAPREEGLFEISAIFE